MQSLNRLLLAACCVLILVPHGYADDVQDLQRQLDDARKSIDQMQKKIDQLQAGQKSSVESQASTAPAVVVAKKESKSKTEFEIYGFAQLDFIQDFKRVNPDWDDTLRPSKIPIVKGTYGSNGQAILSVRQSRLGAQASLPVGGSTLFTKFEFDMFGVGSDEGQTTIRLRQAYGEWKSILAGQTNSLFMDGDIFPNVIDYWGPAGMVYLLNPQIRWTPARGYNSFAIAIEKPSNDIDTGNLREVDPSLGNVQGDEKLPDVTMQFRANRNWGHVQLAGIIRRIGYNTVGTRNNKPKGWEPGWGLDLTSNIKLGSGGRDKLNLGVVYGEGIASYMNDGGTDLAGDGPIGSVRARAVPLLGVVAYFDHYWNQRLSSSIGYSFTRVDNTDQQSATAFHKGEYASVNLLYTPVKNVLMGVEYLWGRLTDNSGGTGNDSRVQISLKYSFSSLDFK